MRRQKRSRNITRAGSQARSASRILAQRIENDSCSTDLEQDDLIHPVLVHENLPSSNCRITIRKLIARGKQGAVHQATVYCRGSHGFEKQLPCAAKRIFDKDNVLPTEFVNHQRTTRATTSSRESGVMSSLGVHRDANGNYFNIMLEGNKDLSIYLPNIKQLRVDNYALFQHVLMDIIESIGRALDIFAQLGLVHGDYKLNNIILCNGWRVGDLGVTESYADFSSSKTVGGSPFYTAPELYVNDRTRPSAVDIYSIGVMLRELLEMPALFRETNVLALTNAKGAAYIEAKKRETSVYLEQDLRIHIVAFDNVIDCLKFIIDEMCHLLPARRPDLDTLKFAFAHLQTLLKTIPIAKDAVSKFYMQMLCPSASNVNDSGEESDEDFVEKNVSGRSPVSDGLAPVVVNNFGFFSKKVTQDAITQTEPGLTL